MLSLHKRKRMLFFVAMATVATVALPSIIFREVDNTNAAKHVIPEGYTTITDQNFYDCVVDTYLAIYPGTDISEGLTDYQISQLTSLNCNKTSSTPNDEKIFDTTGLEKMTGLTQLSLTYNHLSDGILNISHNTALTQLDVSRNYLQSLDASHNLALTSLVAANNNLSSITIPTSTSLTNIDINHNMLEELDLSGATSLNTLAIHNNILSSIDLSNNTSLTSLVATSNMLTSLDVSHNSALTSLNIGANKLTSLNTSQNPNLQRIIVVNNQLSSIDVSNNTALRWFNVGGNQLTSLDVSHNPELLDLYANGNQLTSLDVTHNPNIALLEADNIPIWANPELISFDSDVKFGLSSLSFLQPNQTVQDTEYYTYDSTNKIVTIGEPDRTGGYIQIYSPIIARRYKIVIPNNFLSFDTNEGEGDFERLECSIEYNSYNCDIVLPIVEPTRSDYQFLGWANSPDATSAEYSAGDTIELDGSKTIYAIWAPKRTLILESNNGSGDSETLICYPSTTDGSCQITIPAFEPTFDGHIFLGWAESEESTVAEYSADDQVTLSEDMVLYAVWQEEEPEPDPEEGGGSLPVPNTGAYTGPEEGSNSIILYTVPVATFFITTVTCLYISHKLKFI